MARKAADESVREAWPCYWVASCGFGPPNAKGLAGGSLLAKPLVVGLHACDTYGIENPPSQSWYSLLPVMSKSLGDDAPTPPEAFIVLDLATVLADYPTPTAIAQAMDAECSDAKLSKGLGTQAARALERLSLKGATLVAYGAAAQLAIKLVCTASNSRLRAEAVTKLVLVHPQLSAGAVNSLLRHQYTQELYVVFDSEAAQAKRAPMLQHAFPKLQAEVRSGHPLDAWLTGLSTSGFTMPESSLTCEHQLDSNIFDLDREDGQELWLSELSIELNPSSKQFQATIADVKEEVLEEVAAHVAPKQQANSTKVAEKEDVGMEEEAANASAAALVVRGCRCILVRDLEKPKRWAGMRIPILLAEDGEESVETAQRAVEELCDIDGDSELQLLDQVLPVPLHSGSTTTILHIFSAINPPPPGPLEAADVEDEEDLYDWYTWPRALQALSGKPEDARALHCAAVALANAAAAGRLVVQWGGVFGQEWTSTFMPTGMTPSAAHVLPRAKPEEAAAAALANEACCEDRSSRKQHSAACTKLHQTMGCTGRHAHANHTQKRFTSVS